MRSVKALELDKILASVALCAGSEKGKEMILAAEPSGDFLTVKNLQNETAEAYYAMNSCNCYPSFEVDEITECVIRAKKLSMLTMGELLNRTLGINTCVLITSSIITTSHIRHFVSSIIARHRR